MKQKYKAVYFPDFPAENSRQKSVTLAFGENAEELFESIKDLSSEEIRQLLGNKSYKELTDEALKEDIPLNRYCIRHIKKSLILAKETRTQYTFSDFAKYENIFDPLSATFKGGQHEPFLRWYPYLQGYSPQFVETILNKYSPQAKSVLDPFGGTGTTVFTTSHFNIKSYFCEINPVLQAICLTKIRVRKLNLVERNKLSNELIKKKNYLSDILKLERDSRLENSYITCFGNSQYFDDTTYDEVLRIRTWIDRVSLENPLLSALITISVLAALVPVSRMIRVGDLRYKTTQEANRKNPTLLQFVEEGISMIAEDIKQDINGLHNEPILISENASTLYKLPKLNIDTVITSPPYVNGTNYFRNTKIELWFLRCLQDKNDLAIYRLQSLSAGINDVTVQKMKTSLNPDVSAVVAQLEYNAYDKRIPRMISSYFSEITEIFSNIRNHLLEKAVISIDIGDSCYGGVIVPVDKLLSSCLRDLGVLEKDTIDLRQRRSKNGAVLKQVLMVYEYNPVKNQIYMISRTPSWEKDWTSFQKTLPHQTRPYSQRNWGHSLHSLCSYPGKMKPAIAYHLVNIFVPQNGKVLDPFTGVGTIPFEAGLQGKTAYGFEISPAAYSIAKGKTQIKDLDKCYSVIEKLAIYINNNKLTTTELDDIRNFGFNGKLIDYYDTSTFNEILLARRFYINEPPRTSEEFFVFASLLHILHGNRPYALSRRSHPITPYKPTGPIEYKSLIQHLKEKVARGLIEKLPNNFVTSKIFLQDATSWWPKEIDGLDAIITSPPFFDSTRFYLANWIRLWFSGWNADDFNGQPLGFIEERQKTSFDVYLPVLRQARERLKHDGVLVFHLGKSTKCDMSLRLGELAKNWFRHAETFEENVSHCESHGIRDKGTVGIHQYLVLY